MRRLLSGPSEVAVDGDVVWLRPVASSLRFRHGIASSVLGLLLFLILIAATVMQPLIGAAVAVASIALGVRLVRAIVDTAQSRVAFGPTGVLVQASTRATEVAWHLVDGITGRGDDRWLQVEVQTRDGALTTPAPFRADTAVDWLDRSRAAAAARSLDPRAAPEGRGWVSS